MLIADVHVARTAQVSCCASGKQLPTHYCPYCCCVLLAALLLLLLLHAAMSQEARMRA
jgi:hypothetical protein